VDEPMNKNARRMNLVRIEFPGSTTISASATVILPHVAALGLKLRASAINQVPVQIGFPGLHQRQVGLNPALQDEGVSVEFLVLLALGNQSTDTGARIETWNPAPPALIRSASVPCGQNSTSSSPDKNCRSNSPFSPT